VYHSALFLKTAVRLHRRWPWNNRRVNVSVLDEKKGLFSGFNQHQAEK
jgi:hypothetical protein